MVLKCFENHSINKCLQRFGLKVTAIPCLAYTKRTTQPSASTDEAEKEKPDNAETEKEKEKEESTEKEDTEDGLPSVDAQLVKSEIETIDSNSLKDYLRKRFEFSEVTCKRYQGKRIT